MSDDLRGDALAAATARIERESQRRDDELRTRITELEHHADWLATRVGQLFMIAFGALAFAITEEWLGRSLVTLLIAFGVALALFFCISRLGTYGRLGAGGSGIGFGSSLVSTSRTGLNAGAKG